MKILYFTASGNSLYVAKSLSEETYSIPKMIKEGTYEFTDDKIGIVFPLYGWAVPPYVVDFLKKATFNCDYLFAVVTYGIYGAGVTSHVMDIGKEYGLDFSYINKIKMVDNYLPTFDMEKEIKNEHKKQIEKNLEMIKSDIASSTKRIPKDFVLNKMATNYMLKLEKQPKKVNPNKKSIKVHTPGEGIENYYYVDNNCTQCGVCTKVCPVDNIELDPDDKKIDLKGHCIMCFACIHNCPSKAIHIRGELNGNRYRNSHVKLSEIIKANN